jgi:uncharacterized protein
MSFFERPVTFECAGEQAVGVLALPQDIRSRGVLIVVGGPQYRVGSHRQFLLLSRQLAASGLPVMRFDYRGMGDSAGDPRTFEEVNEDIRAAMNVFFTEVPSLQEVVIWGLCDAASAALMYAPQDRRVTGLVLANPWVRTPEGLAKTMVKHYYGARFLQREFWWKLLSGQVNLIASLRGLLGNLRIGKSKESNQSEACITFPDRMVAGLEQFSGAVLFLLSGQDLTAREFENMVEISPRWHQAVKRTQMEWRRLEDATHTFSMREWREQVGQWTIDWVKSW